MLISKVDIMPIVTQVISVSEEEQQHYLLNQLIANNGNYSIDELKTFVMDDEKYQKSIKNLSGLLHEKIRSNANIADTTQDIHNLFNSLVLSAQCTAYDLISKAVYKQNLQDIFYVFIGRQSSILKVCTDKLGVTNDVLLDLFIITTNSSFKNLAINNKFSFCAWDKITPSLELRFETVDNLSKYDAIDFVNETTWGGILECFRENGSVVSIMSTTAVYFMRLDYLQDMFGELEVAHLVGAFFESCNHTNKVYVNYNRFREKLADACLSQMFIDTDPYGILQWLTDSCDDVCLFKDEYHIVHK